MNKKSLRASVVGKSLPSVPLLIGFGFATFVSSASSVSSATNPRFLIRDAGQNRFHGLQKTQQMLGSQRGEKYKDDMEERLIEVGVFLLGASSGALLKYMQDRKLLHYYGDLVARLSKALQQQVDTASRVGLATGPKLVRKGTDKAKVTNTM